MTPESLRQARDLMTRPGLRAFSFDVFDTVLLRKGVGPDCVYERTLAHLPLDARRAAQADAFVQNRIMAEMKARDRAHGAEVTTAQIYDMFPQGLFSATPLPADVMADAEFKAELDLCVANAQIVELYREARALGLKVGFISDTYWTEDQIRRLLDNACPGLAPDFVYASSAHGQGKAGGLLTHYLADQGLAPEETLHMGDNPIADFQAALALGMAAVSYPQAPSYLPAMLRGEDLCARMLKVHHPALSTRLDQGLTMVRRLATMPGSGMNVADSVGRAVIGPMMAVFQTFIERRVAELSQPGRVVKVAFIARDGFLPFRVWQEAQAGDAAYIEVNRRVALVAASSGGNIEPLQAVFKIIPWVDRASVGVFLKTDLPSVQGYFDRLDSDFCSGSNFADHLPELLGNDQVEDVATGVRDRLLDHLRTTIDGFDRATDLVLVDLGYVGSVQRALRMVFDRAGIDVRLHGVYMATVDDTYVSLAKGDTWRGLLDDTVIPPFMKRITMRNATLIEQCCSAPVGSVRDWEDGKPVRELDKRPSEQLDLCCDIKEGALEFVRAWADARRRFGVDPFADIDAARPIAAAMMMRLLLLPTPRERHLFGSMYQDPNLGSSELLPMMHTGIMGAAIEAMPFAVAAQMREPPTWAAGSLTNISRMAGFTYALMGGGMMSPDLLADEPIAPLTLAVIKDGEGISATVDAGWTTFGDVRIRVPIPLKHQECVVALPAKDFLSRGVIRSAQIQRGESIHAAMHDRRPEPIALTKIQGLRVTINEHHFTATGPEAHLLFPVPTAERSEKGEGMAVLTILISPLFLHDQTEQMQSRPAEDEGWTEGASTEGR